MSVGRGNRKTRKIHAPHLKKRGLTMCELPQARRYVRMYPSALLVVRGTGEPVNCHECLLALVDACTFADFLLHAGLYKPGPHGLPVKLCKRCKEWDEFTSESDAHGICASCMAHANRWSP